MKILYLANIRFPTEKAHGLQILKTCEAFADAGHSVELVVTDRKTPINEGAFAYYGARPNFKITRVQVPDIVGWGKLAFWYETYRFARGCLRVAQANKYDVIYGRDEVVLAHVATRVSTPLAWETHTGANNRCTRLLLQKARLIVAISQGLKEFYVHRGANAEKILVAHDGADLESFTHAQTREASRARLGLPLDKKIVMYIGRLDGWKGSDVFLGSASELPDDTLAVVIGGEASQVRRAKEQYPKVRFLGYRPYKEIADNTAAADVLIVPNTGKDVISARYTSPLKLFAYMAAGKPIVASDLPSIREVLDENCAFFVAPDDPIGLARTITIALGDPAASQKAMCARQKVGQYTWEIRARAIFRGLHRVGAVSE